MENLIFRALLFCSVVLKLRLEPYMTKQTPPLLFLPVLHGDLCSRHIKYISAAKYFDVGLNTEKNVSVPCEDTQDLSSWKPENFPFSQAEAKACLRDIQAMGEAALSGVPLQAFMTLQSPQQELKKLEEQKDLENFMACVEGKVAEQNIHILRAAQKFLLWAWLMEEYIVDLQDLTQKYSANSNHILDALEVDVDEEPALNSLLRIQSSLADASFVLPPWRLVLENMAPFLPDVCTVIVNNPEMAEYISEKEQLSPLSEAELQALHLGNVSRASHCTCSIQELINNPQIQIKNSSANDYGLTKKLHCIIVHNKVA